MGLEGVELVMDVEDEFNIKIEDDEAVSLESIGSLAEYVTLKLSGGPLSSFPCMTAKAFYMFRRQLQAHLPLNRQQIVPKAKLKDLIACDDRVRIWDQCRVAGLHLPSLQLPRILFLPVIAIGVAFGIFVAIKVHVLAMFVAIYIVGALGMWLTECFVRLRNIKKIYSFPDGCETVADLMHRSYPPIDKLTPCGPIDPHILEKVISIVADNTGESKENLTPATRFSADLSF
ncbi:MAG: hypothetical protein IH984_01305 [Planctomycetes bacterium]|nr:hypothetical protein [Planctomycetota bacterium]